MKETNGLQYKSINIRMDKSVKQYVKEQARIQQYFLDSDIKCQGK